MIRALQFPDALRFRNGMRSALFGASALGKLLRAQWFDAVKESTPVATKIILITCSGDRSVARGYVTAAREDANGKSYVTIDWIKQADPEVTLPIGEYELITEEMLADDETGRDYRGKVYLPKAMT